MKYFDIVNEEGTFNVTSDNNKISANLTAIHPELILEDNSMLIFSDTKTYYSLISDADMFNMADMDINVEKLMSENLVESDTVSNFSYKNNDVNSIFEFEYQSGKIYYIQRTGINPLAS